MWLILSPLLSGGKIPGENQGEKPSLGSSRWDSNLWPLPPQSSALSYSVRAFKNQPVIESNSFRVRVIATKELASKVLGS